MALMTLIEYAKGAGADRPYIETFASASDIYAALPFEGMGGRAVWEGYRETSLPGVAFRGINEPGTNGYGTQEAYQEPTYILDHDIDVDEAIVRRSGMERLTREQMKGVKAAGKLWMDTFIAGNNQSNPREFDGIQVRCDKMSHRKIAAGSTSGGDALSLYVLDQAIERVAEPNAILMSHNLLPRVAQAARDTSISGFVTQTFDQIGQPKFSYAGIPIYFGYRRSRHGVVLPFTEANPGGGSAVGTSIYVLQLGSTGLHGIELAPLQTDDVGLIKTGDMRKYRRHISWDTGIVDDDDYCMVRIWGVKDAAWTK
jgi:hypothetical protein